MIHIRRFITAFVAVLACYGLYTFAVAPLFEPPPVARKAGGAASDLATDATKRERGFEHLFAPGSWELDNPKVVENADCTLLIQDYKPLDDGRMELRPCTLIFYVPNKKSDATAAVTGDARTADRRPVVLRAPQGAILQFDKPLDLTKAEFGRLMGGKLAGEITIFSPPSEPDANDALQITTRNVQIDTERAFTPHDVEFRYGSSFGRGRDLTIFLKPPENPASGGKGPPMGGVRAMQLAHVEQLHLELDTPGLLPDGKKPSGTAAGQQQAKKNAPLEIRCKGPLVYDFEQRIIAVDDQVEVSRINPSGPADRLLCSRLMLYLSPAEPAATTAVEAIAATAPGAMPSPVDVPSPSIASSLHRVIAVGSPVVLEAPSSATFVVATRIEYSPPTRRLALDSGDGAKQVVLERGADKFEARQLEYEMAEQGRLGRLWAAGPGTLRMSHEREGQPQTISASWEKELRIRPHDANHVISLVNDATVSVDPMGRFSADELHVWVVETAPGDKRVVTSGDQSALGKTNIAPDRLLAVGNVQVESPQLHADAKRLEAWFIDRPALPGGPLVPHAPANSALPGQAAPPPVLPPPVTAVGHTSDTPAAAQQRFEVKGEVVQLQIARAGDKSALEDLTIQGGVVVKETQTKKPGEAPLRITGETLQLRDGITDNAKMEVRGKPAEVSARGLTMSGPAIHLHRGENRLWIDGPGKANLPVPSTKKSIDRPPPEPERIDVTWQQGMTFDGSTAVLSGEVQAHGTSQRTMSETLEVTLSQPINFAAPQQEGSTEVARLKFDGGVYLENNGYSEEGSLESIDRMEVRNLSIDRLSGAIFADGPGWMTTIRKGSPAALTGDAAIPQRTGVAAPEPDKGLTHLHITFEQSITGNINKREVTFNRMVKAIYAVVQNWDERITMKQLDEHGIAAVGDKGALLTSDHLTVREMPGLALPDNARSVELEALSNTLVEAQSFTARAHRISYTTAKDQLVMEGDRSDAELWHQQIRGGQFSYSAARKIMFWRKRNEVQVDGAKVLDLQQIGGKPLPSIRRR